MGILPSLNRVVLKTGLHICPPPPLSYYYFFQNCFLDINYKDILFQMEYYSIFSDFLEELPDLGIADSEKMKRYDSKFDEWMFRVIYQFVIIL